MKCIKCGQDYQGNFCPNCGTPAPGNAEAPKKKKKFHWWYVLIALVLIGAIGSLGSNDDTPAQETEQPTQENTQLDGTAEQTEEVKTEEVKTEEPEETTDPDWSTEQKNAMATVKSYLAFTGFSHDGLIDQLEYEGYPTDVATWAADNCGADWNEEALESALSYLDFSSFSYTGLIDQLEYEKFTTEQATYAVDNCGADWNAQAVECAKSYLDFSSFSREGLIDQLEYEGFTHEQAVYGAEQNGY